MRWLCVAHEKEIPDFAGLVACGLQPHALGVGQFKSLARFAQLVAAEKPERVVLAGTCGSVASENVMKIFLCQHFVYPSIEGEELPEFMDRACATETAMSRAELPGATVLQNHGLSLNAAKFAGNTGYIPPDYPRPVLENMEAVSLAFFCREQSIPFTAILCATNRIGPNARAEWKANFVEAGQRLAKVLRSSART